MLKFHMVSWGRREFGASKTNARGRGTFRSNDSGGLIGFCELPCSSSTTATVRILRSLQTWNVPVKMHANHGGKPGVPATEDEGRVGTFDRPQMLESSSEMATTAEISGVIMDHESEERCDEEERLATVELEERRVREMHEDLSSEEMMERWEFLKRLPHKLVRDIGYIVAGPPLLSTSKELPTVNPSTLGASSNQWPNTKAWLEQLSIHDVETWFASQKTSQRLGDHFALCIEYVLRHSPYVDVHHLLTSQQVLQRVLEPVRSSRALKALESKLRAQRDMSISTPVDEPIHLLCSTDLNDKSLGTDAEEKPGKRKLKLLKKLERKQLQKGRTNTIGEFDYLFETLTEDGLNAKELHHWEVSVKYLLYAGPWEVFGLKTPESATWSIPDAGDELDGVDSEDGPKMVNDSFLGWWLGPHFGETLLDRKDRLCNQLKLSANPYANLMLRRLYRNNGNGVDSSNFVNELQNAERQTVAEIAETAMEDGSGEGLTCSTQQNSIEESKPLTVVASALLKGYLFYEYDLWCFLELQGLREATGDAEYSKAPKQGKYAMQDAETARLSKNHSIGWWTRNIMEFADLPRHQHSRWYIAPKLEWLSPVVIPARGPEECARVLSLSDFVLKASEVADEAGRLDMPRKRRFLVAELRWTADWEPCHEVGDLGTQEGAWLEVSRGIVVEDSWPDSKMSKPHGYVVSRSPSLQKLHPNM